MQITIAIAVALMLTACRLDPLVPDTPGASAHVLPKGSTVPPISTNAELTNQIRANDGIDDLALRLNNGVIPRQTGKSAGGNVSFWSFGVATLAPAPLFQLVQRDGGTLTPVDHPALVYTIPGDPGYNPLHAIQQVVVTGAYDGELLTSAEALADAIELGLVEEEQIPTQTFINIPIVPAGTRLQTGATSDSSILPNATLFARGYTVEAFRFGGRFGVQPLAGVLPSMHVSFVRAAHAPDYNSQEPIFQATLPTQPPGAAANYSALSTVVKVDLTETATPPDDDADLFQRSLTGEIVSSTAQVLVHEVTTTNLVMQLQSAELGP